MRRMGPAVLNGGLSTILAFILLSTSDTYIFLSFFKIFFLICVFGLYHGLVVLPVVLSLVGPLAEDAGREEVGGLDSEKMALTQLSMNDAQCVHAVQPRSPESLQQDSSSDPADSAKNSVQAGSS
jgi:hypothetical protein